MYVLTRDGLGQGQATWSTRQMFNRPTAQPTLIGYLGNFNGHMGQRESELCKLIYMVGDFAPRKSSLSGLQKKHIMDIATRVVKFAKLCLGGADARLQYDFEGHVDKKTDPAQYGNLDKNRAIEVRQELLKQVEGLWTKTPGGSLFQKESISRAGSSRPFGSDPKKNRRVIICVKWRYCSK